MTRHTDAAFPNQRIVKANGCAPVKTGPSSVFELAGMNSSTATVSAAYGSQTPDGEGLSSSTAPAKAGSNELRIALWSDGKLEIWRGDDDLMLLSRQEVRQLVAYLDSISLGPIHEDNSHG